ncbi:MAG: response regulator transcription factor [Fidelibacterota bacterium]|nr:MAG: response regulator transcription factor [Candidatus Neomarinimicrobiota bacterium]
MQTDDRLAVAIIEDNRYLRAAWKAIFDDDKRFSRVSVYGSCEEAFQDAALGKHHVIIMDINLPGMSGIDGVRYLREHHPGILVLMATVHADREHVFDAICAGAVGYLVKAVTPEELVQAVLDAWSGGSPMSHDIARMILTSFHANRQQKQLPGMTLSEREQEILAKLAEGKTYSAIGKELSLSLDGIRHHIRHIYEKLQVHSRGEAVAKGLREKLIRPPF